MSESRRPFGWGVFAVIAAIALGVVLVSLLGAEYDELNKRQAILADALETQEELVRSIAIKQGPQGEKGDRGERGEKGARGGRGPQGEKGDRGERGEKGARGDRGPQGEKGDRGERGERGARGDRGPQGEKGELGQAFPEEAILLFRGQCPNRWSEVQEFRYEGGEIERLVLCEASSGP